MGVLGKLAFWKKDEEAPAGSDTFNFDSQHDDISSPENMNNPFLDTEHHEPSNEPAFDTRKPFAVQSVQQTGVPPPQQSGFDMNITNKNIEIISAKLDTLKSELESMNQRLINIESIAKREQQSADASIGNMPNYRRYPQW